MADRKYKHPQVNLRLPEELKDGIAKLAEKNGRSANAEMVAAIDYWVKKRDIDIASQINQQPADNKRLKGLLARMLEMVEMAEQDEAREIIEENEAYESRAELDKKTEQSKGNESVDERYKDNPEWGRFK